jgi:error-prone DNA polymerase
MYRHPPRNPLDERPITPEPERAVDLGQLAVSPGARKLELQKRRYARPAAVTKLPYAELHCASAFSFLAGASQPEDLVARAAALDLPAVALIDRNGVYGAPRFYKAARAAGIKALVGAEVALANPLEVLRGTPRGAGNRPPGPIGPVSRDTGGAFLDLEKNDYLEAAADGTGALPGARPPTETRLTLLVGSRQGYRNLCRLLTSAAAGRSKGEAAVDWSTLEEHAEGLHCLTGGDEGLVGAALAAGEPQAARRAIERLSSIFDRRLHVELQRHTTRHEEWRNQALIDLAGRLRLPLLATNGVRYATRRDKALFDILTCIRCHTHLDAAGRQLAAQRERHFKPAAEMARLFADLPQAVAESAEFAERLDFTLADLGYRFPDYPLPPGETMSSHLRQLTWNEARARFRPLTSRAQRQLAKELDMIDKLDLAGYFLIVWDIIQFCKRERIMVQGRGSAANSAVCYALSITAVDPVKMELLFERFLSEERGEWPDIDLDLPSGDQREKVIQYVYRRYGPHGAAMTANVITYRDRSAAREVAKSLGYSPGQVDRLAKQFGRWHYDKSRGDPKVLAEELAAAGFDAADRRILLFATMWQRIQNLPRHLGQHSGGMVIAAGRLDEVVPLEPAAMEGRIVVQWDKDDCADLGIIKVDLLGLGMLQALEEAIPLIRTHETIDVDLAHLPVDDPKTYAMLRAADTVGVFQVESRAQMASLPRNEPRTFYDLVIQVAIIRPGPIVGGMVNPYFERRQGRQPVTYPAPCLEPILKRTLGVVLFQEQILRIAMDAAGFTGGQAEELRRAMGFKRSAERMFELEENMRRGMAERGITGRAQEEIVQAITSFALYGFPESHAASFALIAYASAYLKAHHPTAFLIALLNAWPMGFYHPATLVKDAQRHGVEVLPIDVNHSRWECRWEDRADTRSAAPSDRAVRRRPAAEGCAGAARIGLRYIQGLRRDAGEALLAARRRGPFASPEDLARRTGLRDDELAALADVGALGSLGLSRRAAQWQVAAAAKLTGPLLSDAVPAGGANPLTEMTPFEETLADYFGSGLTTGRHPIAYLRDQLRNHRVLPAAMLGRVAAGSRVRTAGSIIVRQRPGTAKGMMFITLEDETGMSQAIVTPQQLQEHRATLVGSAGLVVEGVLEQRDGSVSIKAEKFWPLSQIAAAPSHDFR